MKKIFTRLSLMLLAASAFASEAANQAAVQAPGKTSSDYFSWTVFGAVMALAIAAAGCGIGQGIATGKAVEGMSRQPEASGQIQTAMILGLSFIESLVIYVLLIGLILLFVNPFAKYFIQ